jgi:sugar phosphate isomerase/epimerase
VIETGARFVLDPRRKHRPSLLDPPEEAHRRLEFLVRCVEMAEALGARVVSVWSGSAPPDSPPHERVERLATGLRALCERAAAAGVRVGFEPEPGMEIERADRWPAVRDDVGHPALGLTLDVGHCLATGEGPPEAALRAHAADLVCVQLDDHVPGVHEHLFFGEGSVDFRAIAAAVSEIGYAGPLEVELSRHGARAPEIAAAGLRFRREAFGGHGGGG